MLSEHCTFKKKQQQPMLYNSTSFLIRDFKVTQLVIIDRSRPRIQLWSNFLFSNPTEKRCVFKTPSLVTVETVKGGHPTILSRSQRQSTFHPLVRPSKVTGPHFHIHRVYRDKGKVTESKVSLLVSIDVPFKLLL